MRERDNQNSARFIRIDQVVGKSFQRPFAGAEPAGRAKLRISPDEFLCFRNGILKARAQPRLVQFIPFKRFDDFKPRAGMIFDGL